MERLDPKTTLLVVVDIQEKLFAAMPEAAQARVLKNAGLLLDAARILGARVLVSEQYPKGLGPTIAALSTKIQDVGATPIAKTTFDACGDPAIARALSEHPLRAAVVVGMESHVCVFQTVRSLAQKGIVTYVAADAVASRTEENCATGLGLCERAGAIPTSSEAVVFDWLERAGTDAFKIVSKLVR